MATNSPGNFISSGVIGDRYNAGAPTNGTDAVQTLTGAATGGTIVLISGGQRTGALPWNASGAAIQAALQALPSIGPGNVLCAGGALGTAAVTVTSAGDLSGLPVPVITVDNTLATGGAVTNANTTPGVQGTARGALVGAKLTDTTSGKQYTNTGTAAKPTWTVTGTQA